MKSFACCLSALLAALSAAQYRDSRPIRAAWLRPPSTISGLEANLKQLANAGITDLYLETLYHGLSTGSAGVFQSRFGYDYLGQAIAKAARYGIRVTAWVESGYWQYGTTGKYLFDAHPEWRATNVATGQPGGDSSGQVFANLCHPGVQQKLRDYASELASVPGLWGVQTDYHRFPIDNDTGDAYPAPWSYDAYSNSAFQSLYGAGAEITTKAAKPGQPFWNQFLSWRRTGVGEAARQMRLGIAGTSPDVVFSAAVFPSPYASGELSKCQDWPSWVSGSFVDWVVPMAYGYTTSGILQDLNKAKGYAGSARLIAGLANTSGHPELTSQLAAIFPSGYHDFAVFEGTTLASSASQSALRQWLENNAVQMRADLHEDGVLDLKDLCAFWSYYRGLPVPAQAVPARLNFDGNTTIDSSDHARMRLAVRQYRLGDRGILTDSDRAAFEAAYTGSGAGTGWTDYNNLWDLDGDGDVDAQDRRLLGFLGNENPSAFVEVVLRDSVGSAARSVTFEWMRPEGGEPLSVWTTDLDEQGRAVLPVPTVGDLKLSLKVSHWLRRTIQLHVGQEDLGGLVLSLVNGDIDQDNAVTVFDYNVLSAYFDRTASDADWTSPGADGLAPQDADLDEDGSLTVFDYNVLSLNFDSVGD